MLVMKFKGAVLQNQETLAEIKNRIKDVIGNFAVSKNGKVN